MLVLRTQLAVTHIHDLAFEWSVHRVRLIFYCSKRHMALMAVKGLILPSESSLHIFYQETLIKAKNKKLRWDVS